MRAVLILLLLFVQPVASLAYERLALGDTGFTIELPGEFSFSKEAAALVAANMEAVVQGRAVADSLYLAVLAKGLDGFVSAAGTLPSPPTAEFRSVEGRLYVVVSGEKDVAGIPTQLWWVSTGPQPRAFFLFMQMRDAAHPVLTQETVLKALATIKLQPSI